jgi:hypothetical protein
MLMHGSVTPQTGIGMVLSTTAAKKNALDAVIFANLARESGRDERLVL